MRKLILLGTHAAALAIGFALGVYFLPILTAPEGPDQAVLEAQAQGANAADAEVARPLKAVG